MKIYIPTYLGDIRLVPKGEQTKVFFKSLTTTEREKLEQFLRIYHLGLDSALSKGQLILPANFVEVHKKFLKVFKAGKKVINAVKFKGGKIELVQEFPAKDFVAGVSIEKPPRGCPMPTLLEQAEIQGQEVLHEFLSGPQWLDFEKYKALIARGNYSGDPYLITSRWNPGCQQWGLLYRLPRKERICASLDDVPPAEEVLAMKLCVELIEREFLLLPRANFGLRLIHS